MRTLLLGAPSGQQTIKLASTCSASAYLTLNAGALIGPNGSLLLPRAAGCGVVGFLTGSQGAVVNYGTIQQNGSFNAGLVNFGVVRVDDTFGSVVGHDWTNNGTIDIADGAELIFGTYVNRLTNNGSIVAAGTGMVLMQQGIFVQANGTTTGRRPVRVEEGRIEYTGNGRSTIEAAGRPTFVAGNLAPQQTLVAAADCFTARAQIVTSADWTNRGVIALSGTCGGSATLEGSGTLTNLGAVLMTDSVFFVSNTLNQGLISFGRSGSGIVNTYGANITNAASGTVSMYVPNNIDFSRVFQATWTLLGGTLSITTKAGFWPSSGTRFPVAAVGASVGAFSTVVGATPPTKPPPITSSTPPTASICPSSESYGGARLASAGR